MLSNIAKLITPFILNALMQINAQQQLPQKMLKTFANTQFDLDPILLSNVYTTTATSKLPEISRQKTQLSVKMRPATSIQYRKAASNIEQPEYVKPRLTNFQQQRQQRETIRISINRAPRAKLDHIPSLQFNQTGIDQKFQSRRQKKLPPKIIYDGEIKLNHRNSPQNAFKILPKQYNNLTTQISIGNHRSRKQISQRLLLSSASSLSSSLSPSSSIHPTAPAHPSVVASGTVIKSGPTPLPFQQISSNSLWFNETLPSHNCSQDFQQIATEFQRKFPVQTARDVREKRLAEVIKQRLIDCDEKSRNNHWQKMIELVGKVKISPIEEETCNSGLIQERIACLNLLSYTCQFISRDYTFRLVPARVIIQEARIIEDGVAKCAKVMRQIKKYNQSEKI